MITFDLWLLIAIVVAMLFLGTLFGLWIARTLHT
jgi:hypothetical protein